MVIRIHWSDTSWQYYDNIDEKTTFIGGNGRSHIDFVLTDVQGKSNIIRFKIIKEDWHFSDHRPILLEIEANAEVDLPFLLSRAQDLNRTNNETNVPFHNLEKCTIIR